MVRLKSTTIGESKTLLGATGIIQLPSTLSINPNGLRHSLFKFSGAIRGLEGVTNDIGKPPLLVNPYLLLLLK